MRVQSQCYFCARKIIRAPPTPPGGMVLPYIRHIGICRPIVPTQTVGLFADFPQVDCVSAKGGQRRLHQKPETDLEKVWVFATVWSENGYRLPILVWNRVWFTRELQQCMSVFIISVPND